MKEIKLLASFLLTLLLPSAVLNAQTIVQLQQGKPTSIRGLSVVDDSVAWISGSRGYIAITSNGGKNWTWQQVKGFEKADFRDIEAFSDKNAVIMSSGTPALVLKTTDGGASWQVKYKNTDTTYFLDAMDFDSPKHGLILGDPIKNKFLLLETNDGGETWGPFANMPVALPGEASFAASGTCLRTDNGMITIITGGKASRMISSPIGKTRWSQVVVPLTNGKQSRGGFSMAYGKKQSIIVGGDYEMNKKTDSVAYILPASTTGYAQNLPEKGPAGFQSSIEFIKGETFIATGTSGSNITTDGGKTWAKIDGISFNVCRKAKHGKLILLAGDGGKIGIFKL